MGLFVKLFLLPKLAVFSIGSSLLRYLGLFDEPGCFCWDYLLIVEAGSVN